MSQRVVSWFSCGATSAVASYLTIKKHPDCILVYCDTGSEHPSNRRFINDCEKWLGRKILVLKSEKYADIWEVFEKTKYLVGVNGARCTTELKKLVRRKFEKPDDLQVFGFDSGESHRAERFKANNPEVATYFPLIEQGFSKHDCLNFLQENKIVLPAMYQLGYHNNNCIGCVKGQAGYWNKIRKDFPEVFEKMAKMERKLNAAICKKYVNGERKRVFLDELPPRTGTHKDLDIQCGLFCGEV